MRFRNSLFVVASCAFIAALLISGGGDPPRTIGMDPRVETPYFPLSPVARAVGETAGAGKLVEASRWQTLEAVAYLEAAQAEEARRVAARSSRSVSRGGGRCAAGDWDCLAQCESGGNWSTNTGNGYQGGIQFSPGTWAANKPPGAPDNAADATREQQIAAGESTLASQGRDAWPSC